MAFDIEEYIYLRMRDKTSDKSVSVLTFHWLLELVQVVVSSVILP
jgi:hypothetical protein